MVVHSVLLLLCDDNKHVKEPDRQGSINNCSIYCVCFSVRMYEHIEWFGFGSNELQSHCFCFSFFLLTTVTNEFVVS